jgi:hypothetical protein
MNLESNEPSTSLPNFLPPPPPSPPVNAALNIDWRHWARRLLCCNPFFLCSAALLLFGVNRLSIDPNFLADEKANLLFNYSALQLYGFLVIGTALFLARRKIWYDSALLVVVENGLVLVPFMLISQATLLDGSLGVMLAIGGCALASMRALAIRRWYPQFNLPLRALALGAVLLVVNTALPLLFPSVVEAELENWTAPNRWLWLALLPGLVAGANFLPRPTHYGGLNPERHWLPLFIYALWVAGTGAHFWCLEHISGVPFEVHLLGPAAVAAIWTLYARITDCVSSPALNLRRALLGLAFAAPLISFNNPELFQALVFVNALGFATLLLRDARVATFARELMVLCLPLAALGLPEEIGRLLMPYFTRSYGLLVGISVLFVLCALRWFRVGFGFVGMVGITVLVALVKPAMPAHAYVSVALMFLLTHSLAWPKSTPAATFVRIIAGLAWFCDAAIWVHDFSWRTDASVSAAALFLLAAWFAIWRISKERPDATVAIAATAVSLCAPGDWLMRYGTPGLIALLASLFLFAIGFAVAWTRDRWERCRAKE